MAGREHTLDRSKIHYKWDNSLPPAIEIEPGDTVHCETEEVTDGQIKPGMPASALGSLDFGRLYPLAGPIYVKGAMPGDILEIEILRLQTLDWGWAGIIPGLGLLAEDFTEPYIRYFDLTNGETAPLREDIQIPIQPFCGTMGVALDEPGAHDVLPTTKGGGNIDTRHLNVGAKLYLPVFVPGALFSAGDCHAAQGDGEVCVSALEMCLTGTFTFQLHKGTGQAMPRAETPTHYVSMGINEDLDQAMKQALREMIAFICSRTNLAREQAYAFCSLAGSLVAAGVTKERRMPRVTAIELIAFIFAIFTLYGSGAEPVLYGLVLLMLGIPVYVWQRRNTSAMQVDSEETAAGAATHPAVS